jgi:hypothetical protein
LLQENNKPTPETRQQKHVTPADTINAMRLRKALASDADIVFHIPGIFIAGSISKNK